MTIRTPVKQAPTPKEKAFRAVKHVHSAASHRASRVSASASFDPERQDFAPYGLTCVHWRPSAMLRPDHHNEVELNFLESGSLTYLLRGRKVTIGAGRVTTFWAAIPHQVIEFEKGLSYFVATIPLPWFLQWRLPYHFTQPLLEGRVISDTDKSDPALDAALFRSWTQDLTSDDAEREHVALLEMQARLLRLSLKLPTQDRDSNEDKDPKEGCASGLSKAEQMACFVARRYIERLTVQDISGSVNLHPNYAMNLFNRAFGTTLFDYLMQHRVSHAQRLLVTTDAKVADVALQSGFFSVSRFNDAFLRTCGCSPREYRRSHRINDAPVLSGRA